MRSAASILIGQDRLEGTQALKPYLHQDLFICCEEDGDGWFEIGSFENALKSFHESATVIELFRKDSEDTCYSFPIQGTESDYCC